MSLPSSWVKEPKENCLLKHVIGGKRGGARRQGGRRKQLLDEFREKRRYRKLQRKAQNRSLWRKVFGRGCGTVVDSVLNVMAHAQKPDFVFRRNGLVHLNQRGLHFSRILAAGVCASAVVMLGTPCSEVVWRVLATYSIRQFPLHFPSRVSPCAITFQLDSTTKYVMNSVVILTRLVCSSNLFNLYAPCILYIGQAYCFSPECAFYIFSQQIYYLIIFLDFHHLHLFLHYMSCIS